MLVRFFPSIPEVNKCARAPLLYLKTLLLAVNLRLRMRQTNHVIVLNAHAPILCHLKRGFSSGARIVAQA